MLALGPGARAAGYGLVHKGSVASTMDEARGHVGAHRTDPCWFVADEQTGGRGRHGRTWMSPPGNLYATLALVAPCEAARAAELSFVAGLALHGAVASVSGLGHPHLGIKWPNDLLLGSAKVAGLLLEGVQIEGRFAVLVGFGVNILSAPPETPYPACCLADAAPAATRDAVFAALSEHWLDAMAVWQSGFTATRAAWLAVAHGLGTQVRIRPPGGEVSGLMRGIDARGCLVLATADGERTFDAGDLFFGD
ncbi:MAG: biotin--[acetyl-CoA-carboxylase] ligase [Beijerinckiaceae bacterium]|nr:biotin--[acetyl-CoA-carboxylase] ligase [Beijerinckiaceae bacterium]